MVANQSDAQASYNSSLLAINTDASTNNLRIGSAVYTNNNYYWLGADSKPGFIANGDVIRINSINKYLDRFDMKFAESRAPKRKHRRTSNEGLGAFLRDQECRQGI